MKCRECQLPISNDPQSKRCTDPKHDPEKWLVLVRSKGERWWARKVEGAYQLEYKDVP